MNVVLIADSQYAMQTAVLIQSLLEHHDSKLFSKGNGTCGMCGGGIYLITNYLSECDKTKLNQISSRHSIDLSIIVIDERMLDPYDGIGYWSKYTFMKILIPQFLPKSIDRCLYLDVDMLVLGNLSTLYDMNLQGKAVAGVEDYPYADKHKKRCHLPLDTHYINSGVMLMDLKQWRAASKENCFDDFVEKKKHYMSINDQDVINSVFKKRILPISPCYNVTNLFFGIRNPLMGNFKKEWKEGRKKPIIMHFTCERKPWLTEICHPYKKQWIEMLRKTPYANQIKPDRFCKTKTYWKNWISNQLAIVLDKIRLI